MKIIFAGTPVFAAVHLSALIDSHHRVVAVLTQPDRPAGRGRQVTMSPVKKTALDFNIPILQPKKLTLDVQEQLRKFDADIMVVVAYGLLIPKTLLTIPKQGCLNVHASLLPRWRGAAPIQYTILNGDEETGVTVMQMDEGLDTGKILYWVSCPSSNTDNSKVLHDKLLTIGPTALLQTLLRLDDEHPLTQFEPLATYAPKINKEQARINWQETLIQIDRKIRAFNPWPIAFTTLDQHSVRIWYAVCSKKTTTAPPGSIIEVSEKGIEVATGDGGVLNILELQLPNGKCLPVKEILNSRRDWFVGKQFS